MAELKAEKHQDPTAQSILRQARPELNVRPPSPSWWVGDQAARPTTPTQPQAREVNLRVPTADTAGAPAPRSPVSPMAQATAQ